MSWVAMLGAERQTYWQVAAKQMVGVYLSIWVRRPMLQHIRGVQVTCIGTGVLGYLGNKGRLLRVPSSRSALHACL